MVKLIEIEKKSRVLTRSQFGCLRDVFTINVTRGCEFMCVYCYARGYPGAPDCGEVQLYNNLPEKLARELDNPRRRSPVKWISFNTASDSFQSHPDILNIAYDTMKVLLERHIGLSFLTKGAIPDRFIGLFSRFPDLVTARIGIVSVSPRYRDLFEPNAAPPEERLDNIRRLRHAGIRVEARIDPIIPFYTDGEASIRHLYEALARQGVERVAMSYLHMRPAIMAQLQRELPATAYNVLRSCFDSRDWDVVGASTRSKLIPRTLRERGYHRFMALSREFGIRPVICACKNPDLPGQKCTTGIHTPHRPVAAGGQMSLFSC